MSYLQHLIVIKPYCKDILTISGKQVGMNITLWLKFQTSSVCVKLRAFAIRNNTQIVDGIVNIQKKQQSKDYVRKG